MPTYRLLHRERDRVRDRSRVDHKGNLITMRVYATIWGLQYPETPETYKMSELRGPVDPHPFGYIFAPPPWPPLFPIGPVTPFEDVVSNPIPVEPPPVTPVLPPGVTSTFPGVASEGEAYLLLIGTTVSRIATMQTPCQRITIMALDTNLGDIWYSFKSDVAVSKGFKLKAGAAKDFLIDDVSKIYMVGTDAGDKICYSYEV